VATVDFNRIASNIAGLNALNALNTVNTQLSIHQTRLATGKRINEAADDPAGLTIATKFLSRSEGLGQALANIGDAKNLMSVAEGGLSKISDILVKMKTKATQAASDTLGSSERTAISNQLKDWASEIDNIVSTTKWNGNKLLDGLAAFGGTISFQVGADTSTADSITLASASFDNISAASLGLGAAGVSINVTSATFSSALMNTLSTAIDTISSRLQTVGTLVSRLTFREETVTIAKTNVDAAYNRIMNADMAEEQLNATKNQVLQQTAIAMLSQANQAPQSIMSLFR
jgi:flagellin